MADEKAEEECDAVLVVVVVVPLRSRGGALHTERKLLHLAARLQQPPGGSTRLRVVVLSALHHTSSFLSRCRSESSAEKLSWQRGLVGQPGAICFIL